MKKLTATQWLIIIAIVLVILWNLAPVFLLKVYGSRPYYEVPTWVVYFLSLRR